MPVLKTAALAAAINVRKTDEILVWYQNGDGYADMDRLRMKPGRHATTEAEASSEEADGPEERMTAGTDKLVPFSGTWSFASATTHNMVYAFGVRNDSKVCMLSPAYTPLFNAEAYMYSVAACGYTVPEDQLENVMVFYLWREKPELPVRLSKYSVLDPPKTLEVLKVYPDANSRLYAYYNVAEKTEYCMFIMDDIITSYDVRSKRVSPIQHTAGMLTTSPLCICIYNETPCMFWFNTSHNLMVTDYVNKEWQSSRGVSSQGGGTPPQGEPNTGLAAVPDTINSTINLFYRFKSSKNDYDRYIWKHPKVGP